MAETLTSVSERVDDMPVLLAHLDRLGVQALLEAHVPTHGHGVGLSLGWVRVLWSTHLLSEGEHRLNPVAPWAQQRLQTLQACAGQPGHPLDVGDDRLASVLEALRDATRGSACEGALHRPALRVYDRQPACVRLESPRASGYWRVTADGRFPCGHRTDHRPDLPPVTSRVSALDPLGMPVATDVVPGQRADDPRYLPAITRVREGLGRRGLLSGGDGKLAALATRALLQAGGDAYGCPLAELPVPPAGLAGSLAPVWTGVQAVPLIQRAAPGGPSQRIAAGCERLEPVTAEVAGKPHRWRERRLVIRSCPLAHAAARGLHARRAKAQAAVTARTTRGRGPRRGADPSALREAVEAILARSRVQGLWHVRSRAHLWEHPVRRSGGREARVRREGDVPVPASRNQEAVAAAVRQWGWRVSATTQPAAQLSLQAAVLADRHAYLVARARGRLQGRPRSLTPRYLEREDHATGVIRLLSLGVRGLTRLECGVRRRLAAAKTTLAGLSVGNPTRATADPTAARLRKAFEALTLTLIREGRRRRRHLTPLARATAHARASRFPYRHLYEAPSRCSHTALKMSEP